MVGYQNYEVNFSVLNEARTDSYLGSGSSAMQFLREVVYAPSAGQAAEMVEARYGGRNMCIIHSSSPVW
jgi:hypothetical protein